MEAAANPQLPAEAVYQSVVGRSFHNANQVQIRGSTITLTCLQAVATPPTVTDERELEGQVVTQRRTIWDYATAALREKSQSVLHGGLIWTLRAYDGKDTRDLMLSLAPFHDCARRLGLDISQVFDGAADAVGGEAGEVARVFGRRSDVTPDTFMFAVESSSDGPRYRSAWR